MYKNLAFLSLLLFFNLVGMEADKTTQATQKLYAQDFSRLGVTYLDHLIYEPKQATLFDFINRTYRAHKDWMVEGSKVTQGYGKQIAQKYHAPVYVKFIDTDVGYGLFADFPIEKGDMIQEYTGVVFTDLSRFVKFYKNEIKQDQDNYAMCLNSFLMPFNGLSIDARLQGNYTRFINHSDTPNAHSLESYDENLWHVIIVASERIEQDQQICIHYGPAYWEYRKKPKKLS